MALTKITAKSLAELKAKLRKDMGWARRLSWTAAEWAEVKAKFDLQIDYKNNRFVADPR